MVEANPPRGLVLTLALPRFLSNYPVFMAVSKGGSGPRFTLLSRFYISPRTVLIFFSSLLSVFSLLFLSPPSPLLHFFFAVLFISSVFLEEGKRGVNQETHAHTGYLSCSVIE